MSEVIKGIHHVGYLVKNMDKAIEAMIAMGYSIEKSVGYDDDVKVEACFMIFTGETDECSGEICENRMNSGIRASRGGRAELVSPREESRIYPLLKKYRNMVYHVCYEVSNLAEASEYMRSKGFVYITEEEYAPYISETARVRFMMNAAVGMIELLEPGKEDVGRS